MTEIERSKLIGLLMLVEDNMHSSASSSGLKRRGSNLRTMEEILMRLLELSQGHVEELYRAYIESLGE